MEKKEKEKKEKGREKGEKEKKIGDFGRIQKYVGKTGVFYRQTQFLENIYVHKMKEEIF